jgi:hypothetical protein
MTPVYPQKRNCSFDLAFGLLLIFLTLGAIITLCSQPLRNFQLIELTLVERSFELLEFDLTLSAWNPNLQSIGFESVDLDVYARLGNNESGNELLAHVRSFSKADEFPANTHSNITARLSMDPNNTLGKMYLYLLI